LRHPHTFVLESILLGFLYSIITLAVIVIEIGKPAYTSTTAVHTNKSPNQVSSLKGCGWGWVFRLPNMQLKRAVYSWVLLLLVSLAHEFSGARECQHRKCDLR
jgi:hypothetical protein